MTTVQAARQANEAKKVAKWLAQRKWSRTDTARWLDDRNEAVLAALRRRPGAWPHVRSIGYWLKDHAPEVFDRVHARLAKAGEAGAEKLFPMEVVR